MSVAEDRPLVQVEHLAEFFPITGGILQRKAGEVKAGRMWTKGGGASVG